MRERIMTAIKDAMRDRDEIRLATLRLMNAAIKDRDIAARGEGAGERADQEAILGMLAKMIRQREESAKMYEEGARLELAERERAEIAVIQEFLPKPLTEEETAQAVTDVIAAIKAEGIRDMGKVMGELKRLHAGRMDFGKANALVKAALSG